MLTPDLVNALLEFRRLRNWEQLHTTRNLACALSVEAAELLEHFVWSNDQQIPYITEERRAAIMAEVADIAIPHCGGSITRSIPTSATDLS